MNDIKLVMTLLVRDEEDIIRQNIDFHLSQGIDFFIVTDNLSEDSTPQILQEYEKKGVLHYIYEANDDYSQNKWVTTMARMAYTEFGADWVINNDADEFWWPKNDTLKEFFRSIPDGFDQVEIKRSDFVPLESIDIFYKDMIYRKKVSLNHAGKILQPKTAHRGSADVVVHQGNHSVSGFEDSATIYGGMEIFHFPIRTYEQFLNKIVKGGAAYERNTNLKKVTGETWRMLYNDYKKYRGLETVFNEECYNNEQIKNELKEGNIMKDTRLKEYFSDLYGNKQG